MFERKTNVQGLSMVAALSLVLLVGACTSSKTKTEPAAALSASAQSAQKPVAKLERFYNQKLIFGSCKGYATTEIEKLVYVDPFECARLKVPLDYNALDGKTMQVAVLRVPAKDVPGKRIGSLVINPGGPGGSGMFAAALASRLGLKDSPVLQRFDMVGFDPRGVGASRPAINCFTDKERDQGEDLPNLLGAAGEWRPADTRKLMEKCAEGAGGKQVLSAVGSRNAARDMDVLRAALRDDKINYFGLSYGTRLGAVYAEMFPHNVRAMVLDGAIGPRQGSVERRLSLHAGFQRSFDLMAKFCAKRPDCPLGNDPKRATTVFQNLVRPLIDHPVPVGGGRPLGFNQATNGVVAGLYDSEAWPKTIDGIAQLKNDGRGDKLLALSDDFMGRNPDGKWSNALAANIAVNCNDEQRRTPEQEAELRRKIFDVSPFLDPGRPVEGVTRDACEFWPGQPTLGFPYAQDIKGLPKTLIIAVTGDPITRYDAGVSLTESLGGTLLTVEGERHAVALAGISPCVNKIFANYLIDLKLPADHDRCVL